jgi:hypothetical protein
MLDGQSTWISFTWLDRLVAVTASEQLRRSSSPEIAPEDADYLLSADGTFVGRVAENCGFCGFCVFWSIWREPWIRHWHEAGRSDGLVLA